MARSAIPKFLPGTQCRAELVAVLDYKRVLMQRSVRRTSWSYPSRIRQRAIDGDCTDTSAAQEITVGVYGFGAARFCIVWRSITFLRRAGVMQVIRLPFQPGGQ
jgi:hypothetical protein